MRQCLPCLIALYMLLAVCPATAQAEDKDLVLRIDSAFEAAEKARTETARNIQVDADKRARELEQRLTEVKKWTTAQFELGERGVINKPKVMTELMSRWETAHEREIYNLLEFADKSSGAIESGRALNTLLAQVGPAAQQNQQTRRVAPADALPLHASTVNLQLSEDTFNHLTIQDKLLGTRDSRRGNGDPIDVDWPAVLREERWADHRAAIEKTRAHALDEMSRTEGITPAADKQLRDAVAALNADYIEYRKHWRDHTPTYTPETAALEYRRVFEGSTHIRKLIASVYYIVQAKSFAELPQREPYHGSNIEELLSYMVRNNLQFGEPSKDTDRAAYHQVFNLMVRYYLDENAMTKLQSKLEQEIDEQKKISGDATNVALGKTMSADMQAALSIENMKFIRDLIKD